MATTFTRTGPDGKEHTRIAYTPADEVQLRFDGWAPKPASGGKASPAAAEAKPSPGK